MTAIIFAVVLLSSATNAQIKSVYTSLSDKVCKTIESNPNEGGSYEGLCPGIGGYKLRLYEGDLRQSINVVTPNKKDHPLDFGSNVTSAFSAVGEKAEWRVKGGKPVALIVRLNSSGDPVNPDRNVSYLVVAKITGNSACITDIVLPTVKNQNARARELADASATKPCAAPRQ